MSDLSLLARTSRRRAAVSRPSPRWCRHPTRSAPITTRNIPIPEPTRIRHRDICLPSSSRRTDWSEREIPMRWRGKPLPARTTTRFRRSSVTVGSAWNPVDTYCSGLRFPSSAMEDSTSLSAAVSGGCTMPLGQRCRTRTTLSSGGVEGDLGRQEEEADQAEDERERAVLLARVAQTNARRGRRRDTAGAVHPAAPAMAPGTMSLHGICFGVSSRKATTKRPTFTTSDDTTAPATAHPPWCPIVTRPGQHRADEEEQAEDQHHVSRSARGGPRSSAGSRRGCSRFPPGRTAPSAARPGSPTARTGSRRPTRRRCDPAVPWMLVLSFVPTTGNWEKAEFSTRCTNECSPPRRIRGS